MPDATTTLRDLRDRVTRFVEDRDWGRYHNPKDLAIALSVEAAELLELFQWKPVADIEVDDPRFRAALGDELADVFIYTMYLANAMRTDLSDLVVRKIAKNASKYPADGARGKAR